MSLPVGVTSVLAKATEVFGSQDAAETWISEPVMGLDQQVPLDLL